MDVFSRGHHGCAAPKLRRRAIRGVQLPAGDFTTTVQRYSYLILKHYMTCV